MERDGARRAVDEWIARDWTQRSCGLEVVATPLRRRVLRSLDDALRMTPRHRRPTIIGCATAVRRALASPLPLGIERELDSLVRQSSTRAHWIETAERLVSRAAIRSREPASVGRPRCRALILFGP